MGVWLISIRPPRAGRDYVFFLLIEVLYVFQSARPVRGGTDDGKLRLDQAADFNPPAPCGAGQKA